MFETLRARRGAPIELDEHLARLRASAQALRIGLPRDLEQTIANAIATLLATEGLGGPEGDADVRVTATRGVSATRGLLPSHAPDVTPTILVQTWLHVRPEPALLARGLRLAVSATRRDPLDPLAAAKTTSRATHVEARLAAAEGGADDALFLTADQRLCETTAANLFLVREGELATPPLACGVLPGITRDWVLHWAPGQGLSAAERDLTLADVRAADELFLTSSIAGVVPVSEVGGIAVGSGQPGPVALRLRAAREQYIGDEP